MTTTSKVVRVLVVDDEADIRDFLELSLTMNGFDVVVAGGGVQALALARDLAPDVVVLDVMMPGVDGVVVLRQLRADELTRGIPVVMLTAMTADEDLWRGWEAGANYYLTKPFDFDDLMRFIEAIGQPDAVLP